MILKAEVWKAEFADDLGLLLLFGCTEGIVQL